MNSSSNEKEGKPKEKLLDKVPDYDHLFDESATKNKKKKSKFLYKIFKMNRGSIAVTSFIYLLQAAPLWIVPLMTANIINVVTDTLALGNGFTSEALGLVIFYFAIMLVSIVQNVPTTVLRLNIVNKSLRSTEAGIKTSVVKKLQGLSLTYHKQMQAGRIQSKFIKDTENVQNFLGTIMKSLVPNLLSAVMAIVVSVVKNGYVSLFFLLIIPCNVAVSLSYRKRVRARARDFRVKNEGVSAKLTTMMEMIPVTKSHGLEQTEMVSMKNSINTLTDSGLKMDKAFAQFGSISWVVNQSLKALCLIFCTYLAIKQVIKVGDIILYESMFTSISTHVTSLVDMLPIFSTGMEAVNSVSEIMNATDMEINSGKVSPIDLDGNVEFKNVSYHYPSSDRLVVDNLNLNVKSGECIAVVGASGSGKSTLMNMVIGFLKPTMGELLIDGKSIDKLNLSSYRHHISVVPQASVLFSGTIRENIVYGLNGYDEKLLQQVVEMANLPEFLKDLPNGLETNIGEHGDNLSGGQKQRITIARALIRNPKIFILDEATSALDNISEYHVQKAIESAIKGRTTFIVAHRLSTIRGADRIVVMDEGKMVECGTYQELMEKKGKFYQLKMLNEMNLKQAEENLA